MTLLCSYSCVMLYRNRKALTRCTLSTGSLAQKLVLPVALSLLPSIHTFIASKQQRESELYLAKMCIDEFPNANLFS